MGPFVRFVTFVTLLLPGWLLYLLRHRSMKHGQSHEGNTIGWECCRRG